MPTPTIPSAAAAPLRPLPVRPSHLLYLHGFRSSPQSFKAQRVLAWLARYRPEVKVWCPQLPPSPRQAIAEVMARLGDPSAGWPDGASGAAVVLGSSLGGFYATHVAETLGWPQVVLNPAVDPARDLSAYIGEQRQWHRPEESFFFRAEYVDELRALAHPAPLSRPAHCLAVIAKGDELLSWREMAARYAGARMLLLEGSDHALSDFDQHLPTVLEFLNLLPDAPAAAA